MSLSPRSVIDSTAANAAQFLFSNLTKKDYTKPELSFLKYQGEYALGRISNEYLYRDRIIIPLLLTDKTTYASLDRIPKILQLLYGLSSGTLKIEGINLSQDIELPSADNVNHALQLMARQATSTYLNTGVKAWIKFNKESFITDQHNQGNLGLFWLENSKKYFTAEAGKRILHKSGIETNELTYIADIAYKYLIYSFGFSQEKHANFAIPYFTHPLRTEFARAYKKPGEKIEINVDVFPVDFSDPLIKIAKWKGLTAYIDSIAELRAVVGGSDFKDRISSLEGELEPKDRAKRITDLTKYLRDSVALPEELNKRIVIEFAGYLGPLMAFYFSPEKKFLTDTGKHLATEAGVALFANVGLYETAKKAAEKLLEKLGDRAFSAVERRAGSMVVKEGFRNNVIGRNVRNFAFNPIFKINLKR